MQGEGLNDYDCTDLNAVQGHKADIKEYVDGAQNGPKPCAVSKWKIKTADQRPRLDRTEKGSWPDITENLDELSGSYARHKSMPRKERARPKTDRMYLANEILGYDFRPENASTAFRPVSAIQSKASPGSSSRRGPY